jgi:hypothetical protein
MVYGLLTCIMNNIQTLLLIETDCSLRLRRRQHL